MKIIASDFDGTVYFRKLDPPYKREDVDAIVKFQKEGNLFGMCTGRPIKGILPFETDELKYDFYICNSGAMIYNREHECLFERLIDFQIVKDVVRKYPEDVEIMMVGKDKNYVYHPLPDSLFKTVIHSLDELDFDRLLSFSLHFATDQQASDAIDEFRKCFPMIDAYVNTNAIDCVAKGCSKATGIQFIMDYYQCDQDHISAIGDNFNDIPMLSAVNNNYTFHNSPEGVKKIVKYLVNSVAECINNQ